MPVLIAPKLHHGFRKSAGPYHVPVIIHRLAVKLNQAAARALTEIQRKALILVHAVRARHMLGRRRHIIQCKKRRLPQRRAAGDASLHPSISPLYFCPRRARVRRIPSAKEISWQKPRAFFIFERSGSRDTCPSALGRRLPKTKLPLLPQSR